MAVGLKNAPQKTCDDDDSNKERFPSLTEFTPHPVPEENHTLWQARAFFSFHICTHHTRPRPNRVAKKPGTYVLRTTSTDSSWVLGTLEHTLTQLGRPSLILGTGQSQAQERPATAFSPLLILYSSEFTCFASFRFSWSTWLWLVALLLLW